MDKHNIFFEMGTFFILKVSIIKKKEIYYFPCSTKKPYAISIFVCIFKCLTNKPLQCTNQIYPPMILRHWNDSVAVLEIKKDNFPAPVQTSAF